MTLYRLGKTGFGKQGKLGNTPWTTSDIWLRRHFNPGSLSADAINHLVLRLYHVKDVEVFLNGVSAFAHNGPVSGYKFENFKKPAALTIVPDSDSVMAVHCLQKTGKRYIDAGLSTRLPMSK